MTLNDPEMRDDFRCALSTVAELLVTTIDWCSQILRPSTIISDITLYHVAVGFTDRRMPSQHVGLQLRGEHDTDRQWHHRQRHRAVAVRSAYLPSVPIPLSVTQPAALHEHRRKTVSKDSESGFIYDQSIALDWWIWIETKTGLIFRLRPMWRIEKYLYAV